MAASSGWRLSVPGALFLLYVAYLVGWSRDPFLTRWIEGCFAFFLALVLSHVILRNTRGGEAEGGGEDAGTDEGEPPGR